jgi:hypothetical protein
VLGNIGLKPTILSLSSAETHGRALQGTVSTPVYVESCVDASPAPVNSARCFVGNNVRATGNETNAVSRLSLANVTFLPSRGVGLYTIHISLKWRADKTNDSNFARHARLRPSQKSSTSDGPL